MKSIISFFLVAVLIGCGQSETPREANIPTVEELVSDPAPTVQDRPAKPG